jgi:hypothetical protein
MRIRVVEHGEGLIGSPATSDGEEPREKISGAFGNADVISRAES